MGSNIIDIEENIIVSIKDNIAIDDQIITCLKKHYKLVGCLDSPLHRATRRNDIQLLQSVIALNFDINLLNDEEETVAFVACRKNLHEALHIILETGECNYQFLNQNGQSAFFQAVKGHYILNNITGNRADFSATMNTFISFAKINCSNDEFKYWSVIDAILNNRMHDLGNQLESISDCNFPTVVFENPIHDALLLYKFQAVTILIEYGAEINSDHSETYNIITQVIKKQSLELLQFSITSGLSINPDNGTHPVITAINYQDEDSLEFLLEQGADVDAIDNTNGQTALFIAIQFGNSDLVSLLIENGASIDHNDFEGNTPLHEAVMNLPSEIQDSDDGMHFDYTIIEKLLELEADVDKANRRGQTSLMFAAKSGTFNLFFKLLDAGGNIHLEDDHHRSVLHYSIENHDTRIMEILLEKGANPQHQDLHGNIAMHCKTEVQNQIEISCKKASLLLVYGSDLEILNNDLVLPHPTFHHKYDCNKSTCYLYNTLESYKLLGVEISKETQLWFNRFSRRFPFFNRVSYEDFENDEEKELECENMKSVFLTVGFQRISLYDFLFINKSRLNRERFLNIAMNNEILKELNFDLKRRFPNFNYILRHTQNMSQKRFKLLEKSIKTFSSSLGPHRMPLLFMEEIFSYFSNNEISNFLSID